MPPKQNSPSKHSSLPRNNGFKDSCISQAADLLLTGNVGFSQQNAMPVEFNQLACLLTIDTPSPEALDTARLLYEKYKTIANVVDANAIEIAMEAGQNAAHKLALIHDLILKILSSHAKSKPVLTNMASLIQYLQYVTGNQPREEVRLICLDQYNCVTHDEVIAHGEVDRVNIDVGTIVFLALMKGATSIIIAHNHPSGNIEPSDNDIKMTHALIDAAGILKIKLIDHLIVSRDNWFSFKQSGYI